MSANDLQVNNSKLNSLAENAVFNVIYRLLNIVFPLVSAGYVARILTAENVGRNAAAANNVSYFVMLGSLGIQAYATREIARRKDDREAKNKLYSEMLVANAFMTAIAVVAFAVSLFAIPLFRAEWLMYLICGIAILFNFINIDWYFQGTEEFKYVAFRSFAIKALLMIAVFIFIHKPEDVYIYAFICVLANGGNNVINIIHAGKTVTFSLKGIRLRPHFMSLVFLAICSVSTELYARMDMTMLDIMDQNSTVAYYSYAQKIVNLIVITAVAVTGVFMPRLSYYYGKDDDKFNKLTKFGADFMIFASLPVCLGLVSVASPLISIWLGAEYSPAVPCLIVLAFMIPFKCVGDIICYQVMMCAGKESYLMIAYTVTMVLNFINNLILIPRFGALGASIASLISEIVVFGLVLASSRKYQNYRINMKNLIASAVASVIMFAVVFGFQAVFKGSVIRLLGGTVVGAFVFVMINAAFKNDFMAKIVRIVYRKLKL